jgi:hypothetical protein
VNDSLVLGLQVLEVVDCEIRFSQNSTNELY